MRIVERERGEIFIAIKEHMSNENRKSKSDEEAANNLQNTILANNVTHETNRVLAQLTWDKAQVNRGIH
jgi:hypothetical protein